MSRAATITRARAKRLPEVAPILRAKAPLRVSFAGGGTDVPPFSDTEGGAVLSATINRHAHGLLRPRADHVIALESLDLDQAAQFAAHEVTVDGELRLVKAAIRRMADLDEAQGFDLDLSTEAPPGSGLGASSALMVCLIGLLADHHGLSLSEYQTAELAHDVERVDLELAGGQQDQYAASFGGFNFIEFGADRVVVNPLRVREDVRNELEANLVLAFTGRTREGDRVIEDQTRNVLAADADALAGMRRQKALAVAMKDALLRGALHEFGTLLDAAWDAKKRMSSRIATPFIDDAYAAARQAGALGGKVTGAGGGGFMLFYRAPGARRHVEAALRQRGHHPAPFAVEERGLRTWTYIEDAA